MKKPPKFSVALETLKKLVSLDFPKLIEHPECNAILSHWLLTPSVRPPQLPAKLYKEQDRIFGPLAAKFRHTSSNEVGEYQQGLNFEFTDVPFPPPAQREFTFIDLFAGIGGFRIAMQKNGGLCVFSSEWNKYAQQTYNRNFGDTPYGDIRNIKEAEIPDHDVLCAGFPCQPFSLAGVSKKNSMGRKHGFEDETQGTLFFEIARILANKRPKAFFLENVKNLFRHDKGQTFEVIRKTLEDELGYVVNWKIVDGAKWVPQHRERLFIVGYDPKQIKITKEEIVIPEKPEADYKYPELSGVIQEKVGTEYTLGPGTWSTLERHKAHHAEAGNGFGYGLHTLPIKKGEVTRTISARYHKDGAEILVEQKGKLPRRLTVEEAMQLQGYDPKRFEFPVSGTQAYRQIGNSVVVPAITATASRIATILKERSK